MKITEVRIKLIEGTEDRLRGFCSVTFDDCFVVRDLKIIEGNKGPFVAMPSRKLTSNCLKCRSKNHLRAHYCNQCGQRLKHDKIEHDSGGRAKLYADIAHPVNASCREMIQSCVIEELDRELKLAAQPGYSSKYDDDYFDDNVEIPESNETAAPIATSTVSEPAPDSVGPDSPPDSTPETTQRIDTPENRPTPHKPTPEGGTDRAKPSGEEFGKGIFD